MYRSLKYVVIAAAAGFASAPAQAQVEVVPSDSIRPQDTAPSVPSDSLEQEVRHVVKRGDTLWDLAKHYLNDPFRWPDVFRRNTDVVEDPHWIYPGEVLRIPGTAVRPDALRAAQDEGIVVSRVVTRPATPTTTSGSTVFAEGMGRQSIALAPAERARGSGVRRGEVDAAPFVTHHRGPDGAGAVIGTGERHAVQVGVRDHRFQLYEHAYLSAPAGVSLEIGAQVMALASGTELSDTTRLMVPTGVFRVVEQASGPRPAKARLIRQFGEVFVGQRLVAYDSRPPADDRELEPVASSADARVMWVHNDPVLPSLQHYVILSAPPGGSLAPGDRLTLVDPALADSDDTVTLPEDAALVQVVKVTPHGATAVVLAQRFPTIRQGMPARLSARLR